MTTYTRFAIRIEFVVDGVRQYDYWVNDGPVDAIWHCQGLPADPTNFGFAILYSSRESAEKAIKTGKSDVKKFGRIVEVKCSIDF
jgi:hypothetical protein